jgi:hypothetical protein
MAILMCDLHVDSLALEIAMLRAKHPSVVVIDNPHKHGWKTSMSWHRMFKRLTELNYGYKMAIIQKHYHDYPMLRQHFLGAIKNMVTRVKTAIVNLKVNCGSRDRAVNKRKNYIKQLQKCL